MPFPQLTRRHFLRNTALVTAATALSARSWAQVVGANSDVRVAVVGLNGRGRNHLASLAKVAGVRVVAICDVDTAVLDRTAANPTHRRGYSRGLQQCSHLPGMGGHARQ